MKVSKDLHSLDSNDYSKVALYEPEQCPICKAHISGKILYGVYTKIDFTQYYSFVFCPACKQVFVAKHDINGRVTNSEPNRFVERSFSKELSELSAQFVKIYNQASDAECSNLDEIAGIGYRKALEFLVKDFCISEHPDGEEKIKVMPLAKCINEFIDNPQIKELAEKCTWLGNDETHYIRKHTDKDLNDLKSFIEALIYFVSMHQIYKESTKITPV